nr:immunoglobulin light chain junction region [Macaca mulatta]MOV95630.1 immunoglobulin light chain junction region [Macaca mulatta]MOV95711.1 immunoglobulin light chain junction region [Macaca mulatta]MOV96280.1 immunoglobulin light chain junction region [Macaca mulatta]MOV96752.1 immunoglobulin light chain junction region [Macaca mulatta]
DYYCSAWDTSLNSYIF